MIPRHLALAAALCLILFAGAPPVQAAVHVVLMTTNESFEPRFVPDDLTIEPGDTVQWQNADPFFIDHATTSGTGSADPSAGTLWDSGTLAFGELFEFTFREPGTYEYFSAPHEFEGMFGRIQVNSSLGAGGEVEDSTWGKIKAQFDSILPR